jgi:hypothetical protein
MTVSAAVVRRRRLFAAMVLLLLFGLVVELSLPVGSDPTSSSGHDHTATRSNTTATMPPAYLAWMPGGFPRSFRAAVASLPDLSSTVLVAGDTRWLTDTRSASGAEVDRPKPPYRIPIDVFAVDPAEYASFIPPTYRDQVVPALREGQAVIGTASAAIRRLGVGGRLTFGPTSVTVGAEVPDAVVGWSELLVSREEGARLGVVDDRYLLARATTRLSDRAFLASLRPLLPRNDPVRVAAPGEVRYVRVASGSAPPVVLKQRFGEFAAYPDTTNPIQLHIDPAWIDVHIVTRTVPVLGRETCNRALFPALDGAMRELKAEGLAFLVKSNAGCFNPELLAPLPTAPPAFHAYAAAIDINAPENPFGGKPTQDSRLVAVMKRWGFNWGGTFLVPDGMHFEYLSPAPGG